MLSLGRLCFASWPLVTTPLWQRQSHFKWQPCWSSPLCQKLRVKMQGKQTSLCVENVCPLLNCQHFGTVFFLHCGTSPPGGGNIMTEGLGGWGGEEIQPFYKGLSLFCLTEKLYRKSPLRFKCKKGQEMKRGLILPLECLTILCWIDTIQFSESSIYSRVKVKFNLISPPKYSSIYSFLRKKLSSTEWAKDCLFVLLIIF